MDGVSSVMAVASLALQLVDSIKQLCDFWESVQEAPSRITGLVDDLRIFAAMLGELQHDEEIFGPQKVTLLALESCRVKVNALHAILQPTGFSSTSKVVRKWASVKAVLRRDKIERFRSVLEGAQRTLMSAQLINLRRLSQKQLQCHETNRYRSEYICAVDAVKEDLAGLRMEQASELVTTITSTPSIAEHLEDIRFEIRKMAANIPNPVIRAGCEQGMVTGLEQTFSDSLPANAFKKSPKFTTARSASRDRNSRKPRVVLARKTSALETFFGSISFRTETTNSCIEEIPNKTSALSEHYEYKTIFRFFPASWFMNIGLDYTINFTFMSNFQGWHQCLESVRAVAADSSIFRVCGEGDLALVQRLLSTGKASPRDQSPNGVTPLHIAAYFRQPAVVQYLLEHGADPHALMQTWNNKLLSPAQMACAMSYDNFMAPYRHKIFGSITETLIQFSPTDGSIEDPRFSEIDPPEVNYQKHMIEVLSDEHSPFPFDTRVVRLVENTNGITEFAAKFDHMIDYCPSIKNIIARCVNLSPPQVFQDNVNHVETITSLAMRNPSQFQLWRSHILTEFHLGMQMFLNWEVSEHRLKEDGWTSATLGDLFAQSYICGEVRDTPIYCERCHVFINIGRMVEWEEYVDSVKNGTFIVRKDQTHKIRTTTPTFRKADFGEADRPEYRKGGDIPTVEEQIAAQRTRRADLSNKTKRYIDELQFWNCSTSRYFYVRLYRTRELYDIYRETGLCPVCVAVAAGEGLFTERAENAEYQAFTDAEEEPPMLAPF